MQYFVVLVDHQRTGMEAIVHPEDTRRQIVDEVRDILASDDRSLVHVKHIVGNECEDVTAEICNEAGFADAPLSPVNRIAAAWDHKRKLRAEAV